MRAVGERFADHEESGAEHDEVSAVWLVAGELCSLGGEQGEGGARGVGCQRRCEARIGGLDTAGDRVAGEQGAGRGGGGRAVRPRGDGLRCGQRGGGERGDEAERAIGGRQSTRWVAADGSGQ